MLVCAHSELNVIFKCLPTLTFFPVTNSVTFGETFSQAQFSMAHLHCPEIRSRGQGFSLWSLHSDCCSIFHLWRLPSQISIVALELLQQSFFPCHWANIRNTGSHEWYPQSLSFQFVGEMMLATLWTLYSLRFLLSNLSNMGRSNVSVVYALLM